VRIKATSTGNPAVHLSDGHQILTAYAGPEELRIALEQNQAKPVSLASADFDEDGVPDLITGYSFGGRGIVTLMRGNVDGIYPNSPEAQHRRANGTFTNAPFLSPAYVFATPVAAEFIAAGDFDGDSHWDVIAASTNDSALYLLAGNGKGEFPAVKKTVLPGLVTALSSGEINRRDGLADVIVGVAGSAAPQVLVFEGPNGAFNSTPEALPMPSRVAALALGQLDNSYEIDLLIASGPELIFLHGRDRQLLAEPSDRVRVEAPHLEHRSFPGTIRDMTLGDFKAQQKLTAAVLIDDGSVELLDPGTSAGAPVAQWKIDTLERSWGDAAKILTAKVSSLPGDELLVTDVAASTVQIVRTASKEPKTQISAQDRGLLSTVQGVDGAPVAILPMRLNSDAFSDLAIVESGRASPTIVTSAPGATFVVTNTNDSGPGSLRQAVTAAEANAGADFITFNIAPAGGVKTIVLQSFLPNILDPVTIDATTQPGFAGTPLIELNGVNSTVDFAAFELYASNNTVRGFVINRFHSNGLSLQRGGSNIIEGNYIGTNAAGTAALPNDFRGIGIGGDGATVDASSNNRIGGTTVAARNIVSGNKVHGVRIIGSSSTDNLVQGNFIGTDLTGTKALGNLVEGIYIGGGVNNTIGGTTAGARNLVSANGFQGNSRTPGLAISPVEPFGAGATGNNVQGNFIGTNAAGTAALGNGHEGLQLEDGAASNLVGGTTAAARNIISGNNTNGVDVGFRNSVTLNQILGNYIGTDVTGEFPVGNLLNGIFINVNSDNNLIRDNRIAFNGSDGVFIPNVTPDPGNPGIRITIDTNQIYANGGLGIDLGEAGITANDPKDTDGGANLQQNFPVLTSAASSGALGETVWERAGEVGREMPDPVLAAALTVNGTLNSTPNSTFTVHWYFSADAQCSTNQAASRPLVYDKVPNVVTNSNGDAQFNFSLNFPSGITAGIVNCTATDAQGNTSEFSACFPVTAPAATSTISSVSGSGTYGGTATLTATLTSNSTPVSGKTINFTVDGSSVCGGVSQPACPATNGSGIATLNVSGYNAGGHPVVASFAGDSSYGASNGNGTLTVSKATPTITWNNPADIVYGTALSGTQLNATASVAGTFVYSPAANAVLNAGNGQTLHVDFTPTDSSNYTTASKNVLINVSKATPTITWSNPANIVYGTALSGTQLNATATNPINGTGVAGSFNYTPAAGIVLHAGNGQTLRADFAPSVTANYNTPVQKTVSINVVKASLTITADNKVKPVGNPNPPLTFTPTGFVNGDTTSVLSGGPSLATTATQSSPVGSYPITITQNTLTAADYTFSFVNGTLIITEPAPVLFAETGTNNLAALDSVTLTRGPFTLNHNYNSDHRTRIIFFTTDLGFAQSTQPDLNTLSVQVGGNSYTVERVGPNSTTSGSYIVFRLPDLSAGTYPLGIKLGAVNSANTPNLQIVSSPTSAPAAPKSNKAKLAEYLLFSLLNSFFSGL